MSRITVGCKLSNNPTHWTRPSHRRGSSWVTATGFGYEDWNFRTDQAVDGFVYGFTQAAPRANLRRRPMDLLLFTTDEAGTYRAVGLYLAAEFLDEATAAELAAAPAWQQVLEARQPDFLAAFGAKVGEKKWSEYRKRVPQFKWRVRVESVISFEDRPPFDPGYIARRDGTPYYFQNRTWQQVIGPATLPEPEDVEGESTIEGRVILVTHRQRERDPKRAKRVKAARRAAGTLWCDGCGHNLGARFGPPFADALDAHHTQPLGGLAHAGDEVRDQDIALLCPTCHRLSHRSRRFDLASLKSFLEAHPA